MNKTIRTLIAMVALTLLVTGCVPTANNAGFHKTISVDGAGRVRLEPDLARVNIGVRSESEQVTEALEDNSDLANAIRQTLTDLGIAAEDIQTSNFNIYPQQKNQPMEMEDEESPQTLFVIENTVSVIVRDLDLLGEALSAVVQKGANTIHGVTFDIADPQAAYAEARQLAIADAKAQAEAIAGAAGVQLGPIQTIRMGGSGAPIERPQMAMEEAMGGGDVPISGGRLVIQVNASITYQISE